MSEIQISAVEQSMTKTDMPDIHEMNSFTSVLFNKTLSSLIDDEDSTKRLLRVSTKGLFKVWLDALPQEHRQYHNCNTCAKFIRLFGGMVMNDKHGKIVSAVWDGKATGYFADSIKALKAEVESRAVISQVLPDYITERALDAEDSFVLGTPRLGHFDHLCVFIERTLYTKYIKFTKGEGAPVKHPVARTKTLRKCAYMYKDDPLPAIMTVMSSPKVNRPELFTPALEFLNSVVEEYKILKRMYKNKEEFDIKYNNALWATAVTTNTEAFFHIPGSVVGAVLKQFQKSPADGDAAINFANSITDSTRYMRTEIKKEGYSNGLVDLAEKIVSELNLANSLKRKLASFEEVPKIWVPKQEEKPAATGVFGHLREKPVEENTPTIKVGVTQIQESAFLKQYLPQAEKAWVLFPSAYAGFVSVTTEAIPGSAPLMALDSEQERAPWCTYSYSQENPAVLHSLKNWFAGKSPQKVEVTGVVHRKFVPTSREVCILLLSGCRDQNYMNVGSALFPEALRRELLPVRKIIEATSAEVPLEYDPTKEVAAGVFLHSGVVVELLINGVKIALKVFSD